VYPENSLTYWQEPFTSSYTVPLEYIPHLFIPVKKTTFKCIMYHLPLLLLSNLLASGLLTALPNSRKHASVDPESCDINLETKIVISWDVTPCSSIEVYGRFEGKYCLHLQDRRIRQTCNQQSKFRLAVRLAYSYSEDEDSMPLLDDDKHLPECTLSHPRRWRFS
jgi:hypothetical protein